MTGQEMARTDCQRKQCLSYGWLRVEPQSKQRGLRIAGVLSRPAFRGGYRGTPLPSTGSGCTLHGKKSHAPRGIPLEAGPVGTVGKMPMPRQATTESFSSLSLRLCAFALFCFSLLPSPALVGYPPETEAIPAEASCPTLAHVVA